VPLETSGRTKSQPPGVGIIDHIKPERVAESNGIIVGILVGVVRTFSDTISIETLATFFGKVARARMLWRRDETVE
ncbi:MAG: hypothetical protein KGJ84_08420, partial [Elusimicrobia bacterium]|nr:hypothetical protein [Elusimicrobiota bacterium]